MRHDPYAHAPRLPEGNALDPRDLFGAERAPIELEIGPGRGGFMMERLEIDSSVRILGLEIRRKWASIVNERLKKRGLGERGRVVAEDARSALARFTSGSLRVVYVHFPDPWWKKRHAKRLVISPGLVAEVARALAEGGELFIQTDVIERAEAYLNIVAGEPRLLPWTASPRVEENPYGAKSPRERRAVADGLPVYRLRYRRA
jgi:tRNA (guanine-N7-)-methyltransferase